MDRDPFDFGAPADAEAIAQHLPRNDVRMMLEFADQDFVTRLEEC